MSAPSDHLPGYSWGCPCRIIRATDSSTRVLSLREKKLLLYLKVVIKTSRPFVGIQHNVLENTFPHTLDHMSQLFEVRTYSTVLTDNQTIDRTD